MDDCDLANRYADTLHKTALANQLSKNKTAGESLNQCRECEADIPEARRKAVPGCSRCITCQTDFEERRIGIL